MEDVAVAVAVVGTAMLDATAWIDCLATLDEPLMFASPFLI